MSELRKVIEVMAEAIEDLEEENREQQRIINKANLVNASLRDRLVRARGVMEEIRSIAQSQSEGDVILWKGYSEIAKRVEDFLKGGV